MKREGPDMTRNRARSLNILIALAFALAMIAVSLLVEDRKTSNTIVMLLIALWWVPFMVLTRRGRAS